MAKYVVIITSVSVYSEEEVIVNNIGLSFVDSKKEACTVIKDSYTSLVGKWTPEVQHQLEENDKLVHWMGGYQWEIRELPEDLDKK